MGSREKWLYFSYTPKIPPFPALLTRCPRQGYSTLTIVVSLLVSHGKRFIILYSCFLIFNKSLECVFSAICLFWNTDKNIYYPCAWLKLVMSYVMEYLLTIKIYSSSNCGP